jgi:enoyl-CoA hydratase/carnithine racemase
VIAAIHGWCVGGGLELALACDVRFASADARFVCAGVNVGLMASAYRLPRLIGEARAKHMLLTGLPHDAATAERFGLITRVCAHGELLSEVTAFASRIASRAPLSVEATKRFVNRAWGLGRGEAMTLQAAELEALSRTNDHRIALEAFLGKKTPSFTGT